jgi:hypothetical protein
MMSTGDDKRRYRLQTNDGLAILAVSFDECFNATVVSFMSLLVRPRSKMVAEPKFGRVLFERMTLDQT